MVTSGKEIENYVPNRIWHQLLGDTQRTIGIYDDIPALFAEGKTKANKIDLAVRASELMIRSDLLADLDLKRNLEALSRLIRRWNSMPETVEG